jgi:putative component of membrane protein insertase Oxa1/YidC/SpoIIIJ protein YidD
MPFRKKHPLNVHFSEGSIFSTHLPKEERRRRAIIIVLVIGILVAISQKGYGTEPCCGPSPTDSASLLSIGIEGYQRFLSPVLASQCYMLPSCSAYGKQVLEEYSPWLGVLLIVDRFFHEANEVQTSPLVRQGDSFKLYDPPSANIWWKK